MTKSLQPLILEVVRKLCKEKKNKNIEPAVAIRHDVLDEVRKAACETLEDLVADNVIGCSENINGVKMYYPISKEGKELKQNLEKEVNNGNFHTPGG